jgi:hypothetical protein
MGRLLGFLVARARERSTWLGVVAFATAFGVRMDPEQAEALVAFGLAAAGAVAVFWPDPK